MLKRFYARSLKEIIAAETQRTVAVNALTVGTKAAIAFVALGTLGVDTTPIVAGVGMVGAAAGFALKDTISKGVRTRKIER
jgi:small-conductance mechanosensitive channel